MRLYHDDVSADYLSHDKLCELFCENPNLDLCDIRNLGNSELWMEDLADDFGMMWRFIPMADPLGKIL